MEQNSLKLPIARGSSWMPSSACWGPRGFLLAVTDSNPEAVGERTGDRLGNRAEQKNGSVPAEKDRA